MSTQVKLIVGVRYDQEATEVLVRLHRELVRAEIDLSCPKEVSEFFSRR